MPLQEARPADDHCGDEGKLPTDALVSVKVSQRGIAERRLRPNCAARGELVWQGRHDTMAAVGERSRPGREGHRIRLDSATQGSVLRPTISSQDPHCCKWGVLFFFLRLIEDCSYNLIIIHGIICLYHFCFILKCFILVNYYSTQHCYLHLN